MKFKTLFLAAAMLMFGLPMNASETAVVPADNMPVINVEGDDSQEGEVKPVDIDEPGTESDYVEPEKKWGLAVGYVYYGLGFMSSNGAASGTAGLVQEVGMLNLLGVQYKFNEKNRLSLGVGYQAKFYRLKDKYRFNTLDDVTFVEQWPDGVEKRSSSLTMHTVQFPLLYRHDFSDKYAIYFGPVLDWNVYAKYSTSHRVSNENTTYSTSTNGLYQRKVTVDVMLGFQCKPVGLYVRYAPCKLFKKGCGPDFDNVFTFGLSFGL